VFQNQHSVVVGNGILRHYTNNRYRIEVKQYTHHFPIVLVALLLENVDVNKKFYYQK
jgi:DNA-directed RNA polymerase subunit L